MCSVLYLGICIYCNDVSESDLLFLLIYSFHSFVVHLSVNNRLTIIGNLLKCTRCPTDYGDYSSCWKCRWPVKYCMCSLFFCALLYFVSFWNFVIADEAANSEIFNIIFGLNFWLILAWGYWLFIYSSSSWSTSLRVFAISNTLNRTLTIERLW